MRLRFAPAACLAALALAAPAGAFVGLPGDGSQVNNDPANSIDPGQDAGLSDVVGGALVAGAPAVPWAAFEQKTGSSQQVFVRAFKNGAWSTQGGSLNIQANQQAEAPSIDFAGAGRTVPWTAWYEPNSHLGTPTQIFASRFNATGNQWIAEGQDRAAGSLVPSLNINTDRTAENPAVAGGATNAANAPVPWVAWEENDGATTDSDLTRQIFVSRGIKQTDCSANHPGGGTSVSQFCWQQVGTKRLAPVAASQTSSATGDPTLNVDPTRAGIEPDDAFTGSGDTVPWVVWYEKGASGIAGLRANEQVFAAKAVPDAGADGGFHWVSVGSHGQGTLDTSGVHGFGACAESQGAEDACSLNAVPGHDAEDPRVAAGSLAAGGTTVPWVVWTEDNGSGIRQIFVARLVGGSHFELFNNGQPISNIVNDSSRPDITFSDHTPYISWQEDVNGAAPGGEKAFYGHFEGGAAAPVFKLDSPGAGVPENGATVADLRAPISSTCIATPFDADGDACQGAAAGTPFFTFLADGSPKRLFAQAYAPSDVQTGAASAITATTATVSGSLNPGGAPTKVRVEFGTTTAYGSRTAEVRVGPATTPVAVSLGLTGLAPGTTVHYRVVAVSDFGTFAGPDATLRTAPGAPATNGGSQVRILGGALRADRHGIVRARLSCVGAAGRACHGTLVLRTAHRPRTLAATRFAVAAGRRATVRLHLTRSGRKLVRHSPRLAVTVSTGSTVRRFTLRRA